jgi:hypothetical protein
MRRNDYLPDSDDPHGTTPYPEIEGSYETALQSAKDDIKSLPALPIELRTAALQNAANFIEPRRSGQSDKHFGGQIGFTTFVIKHDDLNLLSTLGPAAMAIVTYLSVAAAPVAVMAFGMVISVATLASKLKNKGVALDAEYYHVLMTLKHAGPSSVTELASLLGGIHIHGTDLWDENRTLAAMNKLKQVRQRDGIVTELVSQASDGRWSVSGF